MTTQWKQLHAARTSRLEDSVIREILKVTQEPGIISFAGGLPAPELFPVERIKEATARVLDDRGRSILQYGLTEGYTPLREMVAAQLRAVGVPCGVDNILITSGSQQGLDLLGKVLVDPGDRVLVEKPTYLGAMQSWSIYEPDYVGVATDDDGILPEALEERLAERRPKMLYMIPNFQNPSGVTTSLERRQAIMSVMDRHSVPVIEDNPYGELRYEGEHIPPMIALDAALRGEKGDTLEAGNVMYLGTFSKTMCPGFRLAWMVGPRDIIRRVVGAKQATDLHTSTFTQAIAYEAAKDGFVEQHVRTLVSTYRERRDLMLGLLEELFPPEATWTRPAGGMFLWVTVPEVIDTAELLKKAVAEQKVAYVPGFAFYPDKDGRNKMRINFSYSQPAQIEAGVKRLADTIKAELVGGRVR